MPLLEHDEEVALDAAEDDCAFCRREPPEIFRRSFIKRMSCPAQ